MESDDIQQKNKKLQKEQENLTHHLHEKNQLLMELQNELEDEKDFN